MASQVRFILLGLMISLNFPSGLNATTQHDFQTWPNLTITGYVYKKNECLKRIKYWLENQERFGDESSRLTQTLFRTALGYAIKSNLSLWLGYAWIHTGFPLTRQPFTEDRIWEQLLWITQIKQVILMSRTRMEQRFLENTNRVAYRARQLIKLSIPSKTCPKFSLVVWDELFWHKNDFIGRNSQGFDQNRSFIGLGYAFNKKTTVEIGYMNQYIRRFGVPNFLSNNLSINFLINF